MTNLLPPAAKKKIVVEYWTRVICAWVILWSICLFLGVVLLWPTYVLLTGNNDAYAESTTAAIERTSEFEELGNLLAGTSVNAEEIVSLGNRLPLSELVATILGVADTSQVEITAISVARIDNQLAPVSIDGEAIDRIALAQLRDSIEALPFVSGVDLPIDNLAQNEDIFFSLSIIIDPTAL